MADYGMTDLRTFGIFGHGKCGKTSISDQILFKAGVVNRLGSVADGTSVSDFTDEEKSRKVSISSGVLNCMHKGKKLNIIDTPGYTDFFADSLATFTAVDFAVLVIDANGGIQVNTRKSWDNIQKNNLPLLIVVNRMDGEHLVIADILEKLRYSISAKCVPVNVPDATGAGFTKVLNLLDKSAALEGEAAELQNALIERIVEADEALLERYLMDEKVEMAELIGLFKSAIITRSIIPVLFTSASTGVGIQDLMDFIADYGTAPGEGPVRPVFKKGAEGEEPETVEYTIGPDQPLKARVFKILTDPYVGKLCFLRIFSGTAKEGTAVNFPGGRKPVALTQLLMIQGDQQATIPQALPGDLVAVAKIDDFKLGDTLLAGATGLEYAAMEFPEPMVSLAVFPKKRGDEQKIGPSLRIFATEDALFKVEQSEETGEMLIKGMGNLHLESVLSRVNKRFNLDIETRQPRIPYKETVMGRSDVSHKHKKQTGGHGQYGEVYIKIEPRERGTGFEFVDDVVGGVIPRQYIPAVEKGILETLGKGILAGFKIVDVCVRLYFGSYHAVDSSEMAFKTAASKAFRDGFMKAKPVLLEPIAEVEIMIPSQFMGNITGDINSRRGRMLGVDTFGDMQVIKATIPESELQTYSTELRSVTGGEGSYTKKFSHYEVVPGNMAEKVIAKYKKQEEEE